MKKMIVKSKWVFKKKTEQDNSLRFKSRAVSKGYSLYTKINATTTIQNPE